MEQLIRLAEGDGGHSPPRRTLNPYALGHQPDQSYRKQDQLVLLEPPSSPPPVIPVPAAVWMGLVTLGLAGVLAKAMRRA